MPISNSRFHMLYRFKVLAVIFLNENAASAYGGLHHLHVKMSTIGGYTENFRALIFYIFTL